LRATILFAQGGKKYPKNALDAAPLDSGDWIRKIFHVADFYVAFIRRLRQRSSEKFLCLSVASAVRLTSWFLRTRRPFQSAQRLEWCAKTLCQV